MRQLRFLPAAEIELLHEVGYYSKAGRGYGIRFNAAVKAAAARATRNPDAGAPFPGDTRKYQVKGFPFNVVYKSSDKEVLVVAVAPTSRKPEYWLSRLK